MTCYKQPHIYQVGGPHTESNCIAETQLQEWEFWTPHQVPMLGDLALGEGAHGAFGLMYRSYMRLGEIETPFLKSSHRVLQALVQSRDTIGIWVRPACSYWWISRGKRGDCGLETKVLGIIISMCSSRGGHFGKIWPNLSGLRSPGPNNNPSGITAPPISKQAA